MLHSDEIPAPTHPVHSFLRVPGGFRLWIPRHFRQHARKKAKTRLALPVKASRILMSLWFIAGIPVVVFAYMFVAGLVPLSEAFSGTTPSLSKALSGFVIASLFLGLVLLPWWITWLVLLAKGRQARSH